MDNNKQTMESNIENIYAELSAFDVLSRLGEQTKAREHLVVASRLTEFLSKQDVFRRRLSKSSVEILRRENERATKLIVTKEVGSLRESIQRRVQLLKKALKVPGAYFRYLLTAFVVVGIAFFYSRQILIASDPPRSSTVSAKESLSDLLAEGGEVLFLAEFESASELRFLKEHERFSSKFKVSLPGFEYREWERTPRGLNSKGFMFAKADAVIHVTLAPKALSTDRKHSLLIYTISPDSQIDSLLVGDCCSSQIVDDIREGKWVRFPLSEREVQERIKTISIKNLTGYGARVYALALVKH